MSLGLLILQPELGAWGPHLGGGNLGKRCEGDVGGTGGWYGWRFASYRGPRAGMVGLRGHWLQLADRSNSAEAFCQRDMGIYRVVPR